MSVHVQSPVWLIEMGSVAFKCIALKLADCANDDGASIYPSVSRISRECDCDEATVNRALVAFEECGLIEVTDKTHGNRRYKSTVVRRFDLQKFNFLAAVDNRDGTFTPPTHCLKQVETGEMRVIERGRRKGEQVPVSRYVIAERGPDDSSKYDALAPAGWVPPWQREPALPLASDEGCPSHSATQTILEPSLNNSLSHESERGRAGGKYNSIFQEMTGNRKRVADLFLGPVADLLTIATPTPTEMFSMVAGKLANEPDGVLEAALDIAIETRKKIVSPKCLLDCVAAAKQQRRAPVAKETVRITREEAPRQFAAWLAWAGHDANRADRQAQLIRKMVGEIGVSEITTPSEWPPGAAPSTTTEEVSA